ncbi:MAG: hypothetical protein V4641_07810 [Pseudomonadota bacterium]|jgi:hypothetical protein
MRYIIAAAVLAASARGAAALPSPPPSPPPASPPVLTDEIIKKAVRETIAENPQPLANRNAGAFSAGTAHDKMSAAFEQAKVPDCLHGDALKHQPAQIGPIAVVGPYSLPWVIAAALRGKCN